MSMANLRIRFGTASLLLAVIILSLQPVSASADGPPTGAVASAHPLATTAGLRVLSDGGNAFDAAVAISAALAVVEPAGSGLGGGGFWLLHREQDGKKAMIDGREKAPEFAHRRMYLDEQGNVRDRASLDGPLAGGIPGIPAGMVYLSMNYGRLPLAQVLAPAIAYAEQGFEVTAGLQSQIRNRQSLLASYPSSAAVFLPEGKVPDVGQRLIQTDLANTLRSIAEKGYAGFYQGTMARKLVQGMQTAGGIWSLKDLADYVVLERRPIEFSYRDIKVTSASPPSSGGVALAQILKMLEKTDLQNMDRVARAHNVIEAMRRAYRDRAVYLGDPDYYPVPVEKLLDEDYVKGLAMTIDPDRATPSDELGDTPGLEQTGESTTHFSVIDTEGNRVGGTLSLNLYFGSGFVIPGTGVLVNDEMDDFSIKADVPNAYGLIGDEANAIEPGKRPLSSMSPTFVESSERVGILGTPGGSRIITMVLLGILDFAEGGLPESWVDHPRYHHQYRPDVVLYEGHTFNADEQKTLQAMGHKLRLSRRFYGNMQALMWDRRTDFVYAASDKRGEGDARLLNPITR